MDTVQGSAELRYGSWTKAWFCVGCGKGLSNYEVHYSNGVCPYCGNRASGTICDCKTDSIRPVYQKIMKGVLIFKLPRWKVLYWESVNGNRVYNSPRICE